MTKKKKTVNNPKNPKSTKIGTTFQVTAEAELLPYLIEQLSNKSRNSVKSILTRGQVTVDDVAVTKHNHPLKPGQIVGIQDNQTSMSEQAIVGIEIVYEDNDLIIIEKEAGILSISPQRGVEVTAHGQLMDYIKRTNPKNRIYIVHRLDRDTSGLMVFAKNEKTKKELQDNWKDLVLERMYTALVEGQVKRPEGTITSWLTEGKTLKVYSSSHDNGGKKAVTHYKKMRDNQSFSLLEVQLETGRKNQIRVHMEEIGHPIVGDKKYGAHGNPMKRLGLHATSLVIKHPVTGEVLKFKSKVPPKFRKAMKEKNE